MTSLLLANVGAIPKCDAPAAPFAAVQAARDTQPTADRSPNLAAATPESIPIAGARRLPHAAGHYTSVTRCRRASSHPTPGHRVCDIHGTIAGPLLRRNLV